MYLHDAEQFNNGYETGQRELLSLLDQVIAELKAETGNLVVSAILDELLARLVRKMM